MIRTPRPPRLIRPNPEPLALPKTKALNLTLAEFLPQSKATKRLRERVLRVLTAGVLIWKGTARYESGLMFHRKPVTTVKQLMFAIPPVWRKGRSRMQDTDLGAKSLLWLEAQLKREGLGIGAAVPPNDYD